MAENIVARKLMLTGFATVEADHSLGSYLRQMAARKNEYLSTTDLVVDLLAQDVAGPHLTLDGSAFGARSPPELSGSAFGAFYARTSRFHS